MFYDAIKGEDPDSQRAQLRTYVHELGHAFNLLHSWQKNLADPPAAARAERRPRRPVVDELRLELPAPPPAPGGDGRLLGGFPFQFTDNELIHLRHGFYRNVIMGANPFGKGAAEIDPDLFADPIVDNSGLALELRAERRLRATASRSWWSSS